MILVAGDVGGPDEGYVSLFPSERHEGVALSQEKLIELSTLYSSLYVRLCAAVAGRLASRPGVGPAAARTTVREALVPIVHFYLDRLLRLELLLLSRPGASWRVPRPASAPTAGRCGEFNSLCFSSHDFNQDLLCRLAALWNIPLEGGLPAASEAAPARPAVNRNFEGSPASRRVLRYGLTLLDRFLRSVGIGRRIPTLSMAYHTLPLRDAGFYFLGLENVQGRFVAPRVTRDPSLREELLAATLRAEAPAIVDFLLASGFRNRETAVRAAEDFADFVAEQYPPVLLEGLAPALRAADAVLSGYGRRPLWVAEVNNDEATFLIAAARERGQEVIGFQHGGHSGYIDDHTGAVEYEYGFFDRFVSWGWDVMPDFDVCRSIPVSPLPSPWLDARARHWARALPENDRDPRGKPYGFLFMSNKVYRFPPAPSGAAVARSDRLKEIVAYHEELAAACAARKVGLLHKPYNEDAGRLTSGLLARLARDHAPYYRRLVTADKGLHADRLRECAMVLWDQPGTGFLECLAAGIPTLVFWPRHYNREEPRRREAFRSLEEAGLVHRTAVSALDELARFTADPAAWRAQPARVNAVKAFARELGWSDPDWVRHWKAFLKDRTPV